MTDESSLKAAVAEAARSGDWQVFAERMRALRAEHPNDAYVRLYHGIALEKDPQTHSEAVREIKKAVELEPENPDHLALAAGHLYDLGELDLAREYVRRASELPAWSASPYAADILEVAGKIAADDGDDDRARMLLASALTAEPEDRYHARSYARFLIEHQEHAEAVAVAEAGLTHHPDDDALRDIRQRAGWFDVVRRALSGDLEHLRCPVNDDADLVVELAESATPTALVGGRLRCPACAAEVEIRPNA